MRVRVPLAPVALATDRGGNRNPDGVGGLIRAIQIGLGQSDTLFLLGVELEEVLTIGFVAFRAQCQMDQALAVQGVLHLEQFALGIPGQVFAVRLRPHVLVNHATRAFGHEARVNRRMRGAVKGLEQFFVVAPGTILHSDIGGGRAGTAREGYLHTGDC